MDSTLINRALIHYRNNGFISLTRSAAKFTQRRTLNSVSQRVVRSRYTDLVIDSHELRTDYSERLWELDENLDGLSTDINREIAPLKNDPQIKINCSPRYSFIDPFVSEVSSAVVAGEDAVAFMDDGRCLSDPTDPIPNHSSEGRLGRSLERAITSSPVGLGIPIFRGNTPEFENTVECAAILHSRWNNYYHWMLEHLLKLRGVSRYERATGQNVTLIIPPNPNRYIVESLDLMGYTDNDYIQWNKVPIGVDKLVVPSFPSLTLKTIEWMRSMIARGVDLSDTSTCDDWVYISRQKVDKRRILNYDEFKKLMNKYGVRTVYCEDLSLEEEIKLFSSVSGIIGPHGAGLTAAVWGENIHLVEIFNNVVKAPYYVLAHVLDHDYTAFNASPVDGNSSPRNNNMKINIGDFEAILNQVIN